jgi:hypothetical protein
MNARPVARPSATWSTETCALVVSCNACATDADRSEEWPPAVGRSISLGSNPPFVEDKHVTWEIVHQFVERTFDPSAGEFCATVAHDQSVDTVFACRVEHLAESLV